MPTSTPAPKATAVSNGATGRTKSAATICLEQMAEDIKTLAWLHHEQTLKTQRVALIVAGLLAQQAQPQIQQELLNRILA